MLTKEALLRALRHEIKILLHLAGKIEPGMLVLNAHGAYRTQLVCYSKSCGREKLGTMNLWAGVDAPL